eukprot:273305-Hanusia_phi.AAC.5
MWDDGVVGEERWWRRRCFGEFGGRSMIDVKARKRNWGQSMPNDRDIQRWKYARNFLLARMNNFSESERKKARKSDRIQRFVKLMSKPKPEHKVSKKSQQEDLKFWSKLARKSLEHLPTLPKHYSCNYTSVMDNTWFMLHSGLVDAPQVNDVQLSEESDHTAVLNQPSSRGCSNDDAWKRKKPCSPVKTCREDMELPMFSPTKLAANHLLDLSHSLVC